jgi:hypothetical protein
MGQGCGSQAAPALESGRGRLAALRLANRRRSLAPTRTIGAAANVVSFLSAFDWRKGGKARANEWRTEIATRASARRDY